MNDFISAVILGIVEGITEFLPISSTGHLILVNRFVGFTGKFANTFDVVIQLGAILSVIVYFWNRLFPFGSRKSIIDKTEIWRLWRKTIVGVLPAIVLGVLCWDYVEEKLFNPFTVAISLVVGGIILIILESTHKKQAIRSIGELSYKTAFLIGLFQCLAMIPGTSRSAATIIGAMVFGASRGVATEFSFFLAIPTMMAASVYSLYSMLETGAVITATQWQVLAVGFVVSFFVALGVVAALLRYIQKRDFKIFGYYRILIGLVVLVFGYLVF
ncbi:undecaprenyl-diphosphate phosphatase [Candidatus Formimonas warabiya]|uniref:Undecaprenyl-diphosphatase n=1 Tax=Formimonas warabiya TaxID=1761012 RepID=A0A3G1KU59_FORW1|nr:undecaprenyl-diphosphate phosphatase [Candidatus Formimonas warabiya]ATW26008.1 undecaprenyl-diphosphatase [Candidatus Formimonas warabiya]